MVKYGGSSIRRVFFEEGTLSPKEIAARLSDIAIADFDIVHGEIGVGTNSVFYAMTHVARHRRAGIVVTLHDPPLFVFSPTVHLYGYKTAGALNKAVRKLVTDPFFDAACLPRLASRLGHYVVLNRGATQSLARRFRGIDVRYAPLIASGTGRVPASGAPTEILFFGFLARAKGVELGIHAVRHLQQQGIDLRLHVVGGCLDQAYERFLIDLVTRLSLERNVVWHGLVDDAQLDQLFAIGGMVIMPYRETNSLSGSAAAVRAMEYGLPVIFSDIRRFVGEYVDGKDALMFRAGDSLDLAEKMRAVITDECLRERLKEGSRRRIEFVHDPKTVAGIFRALYDELVRGWTGPSVR